MSNLQSITLRSVRVGAVLILLWVATPLSAQQPLTSPYRDQLASPIRGLTAKEIEDLREARGMGLARAAELNGYPGPRHLLDAVEAGQFHLSSEQLSAVRRLFDAMSAEARGLGNTILSEERALESAFRSGIIDAANLHERIERIAALQGELRAVHLRTHLETRALLTEPQIQRYNELRGYAEPEAGSDQHNH